MNMEQWSTVDVANFLGVAPGTVRAYSSRGQMPQPDGKIGASPWWWASTIREWQRPGRGSRSDLK